MDTQPSLSWGSGDREAMPRLLRSVSFRCLAKVNVSLQPRPSGLRILQPGPIVLDPSEHVKEASSSLVISIWQGLVPQIPNLVKIGRLNVMLCVSGDDGGLDLLLPELPKELFSGLVEYEAAADLDI